MVKIGIIDSGIDEINLTGKNDIKGICLKKDDQSNEIHFCENIFDQNGHGNECFKIISSIIPDASYYIVKIFEKELVTDLDILAVAIQACVVHQVDIINISAGVKADDVPELLRIVCDEAYNNNVIIVSAQHNQGVRCYPANYTKVIGVGTIELADGEMYRYASNDTIEFYTSAADIFPGNKGWSNSTSFACAKMTAYAAEILQVKGKMKMEQLMTELINNATGSKIFG